jgi:hypothetical protein
MAKLKITKTNSVSGQIVDAYVNQDIIDSAHVGGTGGLTSQTGKQLQPTVKVGTNSVASGSILFQKGAHKFRVTDGTNVGTCTLVNLATPTVGNTMSLQINTAILTNGTALAYVASGASTSAYVTGTFAGPIPLAIGQVVTGTGATGTVTITAINGAGNVTVGYASQTFSNIASAGTFNTTVYASRVTNKFVYDFGSDGNLSDNIAGGYNPNKYRYRLSTPDSTFVQVASA